MHTDATLRAERRRRLLPGGLQGTRGIAPGRTVSCRRQRAYGLTEKGIVSDPRHEPGHSVVMTQPAARHPKGHASQ